MTFLPCWRGIPTWTTQQVIGYLKVFIIRLVLVLAPKGLNNACCWPTETWAEKRKTKASIKLHKEANSRREQLLRFWFEKAKPSHSSFGTKYSPGFYQTYTARFIHSHTHTDAVLLRWFIWLLEPSTPKDFIWIFVMEKLATNTILIIV